MRRTHLAAPRASLALLVAGLLAPAASGQCATAVFVTPDEADFGAAVALHGDRALVGDPTGGGAGGSAGVAWLLERGPWSWKHAATWWPAPGTAGNARYGAAVALGAEYAAVGAPGEAGAAGAVYAYRREAGTWLPVGRFLAPDASAGDAFGATLALDGDRLAVGAPGHDAAGPDAGAVYLCTLGPAGPQPDGKLLGAGALPGDGVGLSLALRGGVLAAGTREASLVWVWELGASGWTESAVLAAPEAGALGRSLALEGDALLAGSPTTHGSGIQSGAAHLFRRGPGGWALEATLMPPVAMVYARFGEAVALQDGLAAIGAPSAHQNRGAVWVLSQQPGGWLPRADFAGLDGPDYAGLGAALALVDDVLLVGAVADFGPPGAAYVLGGLRPWQDLGGGVPGGPGAPALVAHGTLCGGSPVALEVSGGRPSAPVMFVVGFSETAMPVHGGTLWPSPDLLRFDVLDVVGRGLLAGTWPIGQPAMQAVIAQAWIADPAAPGGLAATPGLATETP